MLIKNTMSKFTFVMKHIIYSVIVFIVNDCLFYKKMDQIETWHWLLAFLLYECSIVGIAVEIERRRNEISVIMNIIIAYGLYTSTVYFETRKEIIFCAFIGAAILSFLFIGLIFKEKKKELFKKCIFRSIAIIQLIFSVSMVILIMSVFSINKLERVTAQKAVSINMNMETDFEVEKNILKLQNKIWNKLSLSERMDVLSVVVDIECDHLGMSKNLSIITDYTLDETTLGTYSHMKKEITINMDVIYESGEKSLEVLLHEIRHAFQHSLVEVYQGVNEEEKNLIIFTEIQKFASEFMDYEDENYKLYYNQHCEQDSRQYVKDRIRDYYYKIYEK